MCARPRETYLPPKNRVGGFSATSPTHARLFASQPLETHWENEPTPTTTASGVSFYGFRFYNPELGRWINRDPIEEKGGLNIYGFIDNNTLVYFDVLGLLSGSIPLPGEPRWGDIFRRLIWEITHSRESSLLCELVGVDNTSPRPVNVNDSSVHGESCEGVLATSGIFYYGCGPWMIDPSSPPIQSDHSFFRENGFHVATWIETRRETSTCYREECVCEFSCNLSLSDPFVRRDWNCFLPTLEQYTRDSEYACVRRIQDIGDPEGGIPPWIPGVP